MIFNKKKIKNYLRWVEYMYLSQYNFHTALLEKT